MPVDIDYGALKQPNFLADALTAYQTGRSLAQQRGVQNALAKVGTDPAGAQADLIRYGDVPTATAVANLGYIGAQRRLLTGGYNALLGGGQPDPQQPAPAQSAPAQPVAQPNGQPQQPQQAPNPANLNPDQQAHALQTADTLDQLGVELSSLPYEQRAARLQQEAPNLLARLGPQAAQQIQNFDPTDANLAQVHQGTALVRQQIGAAAGPGPATQAVTGAAGAPPAPDASAAGPALAGAAPAGPQPAPDPNAPPPPPVDSTGYPVGAAIPTAQPQGAAAGGAAPAAQSQPQAQPQPQNPGPGGSAINLMDPGVQRALEMIHLGGGDISGLVALGSATMPSYQATRSGLIYNARTGQFSRSGPNDQGIEYDVGPDGNVIGAHNVPGYVDASAVQTATKAAAEAAGKLPYAKPLAQAQSSGEHAGAAPYDLITVNMPADATHPGGYTAQMTLDQFKALKGSGIPATAGVGQSAGPGAEEFGKQDAEAFSNTVSTVANPTAMMHEQNSRDVVLQALHTVQGLDPNAFTADKYHAMSLLRSTGLAPPAANDFVNNVATYSGLLPQVLRGTFSTFPRLEKEFEVVKAGMANISTPRDAASVLLGTQAAIHDRNLAFSNFVSNYKGAPSEQAMTQAFNSSPAGQASMFADPVWQNMTIGGKPAVMVGQQPVPTGQPGAGHVWGIFRPGTKFAQTFMVQ